MDKVVIISGGSRGLGAAIVEGFLKETPYFVSTLSRSRTPFIEKLESEPGTKERFMYQSVDMGNPFTVAEYVRNVRHRFGSVDILVNNAGVAADDVLALQDDSDINLMIDVNLKGTVTLTKMCVREMLPQRWGRIVTITSIVGRSGYRGLSVYSLTKAGLDGLTRSLSRELGNRGVTVNSVAPGFLDTEMSQGLSEEQRQQIIRRTPIGRLGRADDIVPAVLFLCSESGAFITGQTIVVDGGVTA